MTPRLRVFGKEVISALQRAGFEVTRTRGSHRFLRHSDGRVTTVPVHAGEIIGPGLLSKILRDAKLSRAEFEKLLKS
jgi:predicted RNA binding protein YcfA (HicA-like mRNA interferase family)